MMNNKVSFTNSNNPTISLSAVIYFPPKFDETRQYQAIVLSHPGGGVKEQTAGIYAKKLAEAKGKMDEFHLYETVEEVSKDLIMKAHLRYKPVCANVDFYSGFVYTMLGIPRELFTPIFAIARISGWSAHRLEELVNKGKIIRPAYKYVGSHVDFREIDERE